jgi:hypothetical protein
MSWNSPRNWSEITASVAARYGFNAPRHGMTGVPVYVLTDVRGPLYGHIDDFAREVIASNDRVRSAYMSGGRDTAYGPGDYVYVVARDGNAIAAITHAGDVVVNPMVYRGLPRYVDAIRRLFGTCRTVGERLCGTDRCECAYVFRPVPNNGYPAGASGGNMTPAELFAYHQANDRIIFGHIS